MNHLLYTLKVKVFLIVQSILSLALILRFTVVLTTLTAINISNYKLIPFALILDIIILKILQVIHNNRSLKKYISYLSRLRLESVNENDFIKSIIAEAKKYQLFKIGNKGSGKEIYFLRADKDNFASYVSFTTFNGISCVLLPRSADISTKKEKIILTHELAHCISDDILFLIATNIKALCVFLGAIVLFISGINYISLLVFILGFVLYKMQFWVETHAEISANNTAMEILDSIDESIGVQESSKLLWIVKKISYDLLISKEKRNIQETYKLTSLKEQLRYLQLAKENGTLINYLSPINTPIGLLIILLYFFAIFNIDKHSQLLIITWQNIFWYVIIAIVLQIIYIVFLIKEKRKKWIMKSLIGQKY